MSFRENSSPSCSPNDLAVIEVVLRHICKLHAWSPRSESAMEAGRFLLATFDDGVTDSMELLDHFKQAAARRAARVRQD